MSRKLNKYLRRVLGIERLGQELGQLKALQLEFRERDAATLAGIRSELGAARKSAEDQSSHLLRWAVDTAGVLARVNRALENLATSETVGLMQARLEEFVSAQSLRERQQLDWTKLTGKAVSEIRHQDIARILAKLEGFEHRLQADIRARAVYRTGPANFAARKLAADKGGGDAPGERAFALAGASVDPELEGLLALARWTGDDIRTSVFLSQLTRPRLRALFPEGSRHVRAMSLRSGLTLEADMADIFAATAALGWIQEAADFEIFMSMVEPGSIAVDVGANFGLYGLHAAHYGGSTSRVFAFEPAPEAFDLLEANVARNGLAVRCRCVKAAVGAAAGKATFNIAADSVFSGLLDTGRSPIVTRIETDVIALDSLPELAELPRIDLLKIDVEGSEAEVLAGARQLLGRSPDAVVMFEFSHKNLPAENRQMLLEELERLESAGFSVYGKSAYGAELVRLRPSDLDGQLSENLFLCGAARQSRVRLEAVAARVLGKSISAPEAAALALLKREALASVAS